MVKHVLRGLSIVISLAGAALGLANMAVDDKRQDIKIQEEVARQLKEQNKKDSDEENEEES